MTIYLDLIFFMNLTGDFLCLCMTSSVIRRFNIKRGIFSCILASLLSIGFVVWDTNLLIYNTAKFLMPAIIVFFSFAPFHIKEFFRLYSFYLVSSMMLSGGIDLICNNTNMFSLLFCMLGLCGFLYLLLSSIRSQIYSRHMYALLTYKKKKVKLDGFYDSGNRLFFSNGDFRVIIANEKVLKDLIDENATLYNLSDWVDHTLKIPFSGAACGYLEGFLLDNVIINHKKYNDVILAISPNQLQDELILHSTMI